MPDARSGNAVSLATAKFRTAYKVPIIGMCSTVSVSVSSTRSGRFRIQPGYGPDVVKRGRVRVDATTTFRVVTSSLRHSSIREALRNLGDTTDDVPRRSTCSFPPVHSIFRNVAMVAFPSATLRISLGVRIMPDTHSLPIRILRAQF